MGSAEIELNDKEMAEIVKDYEKTTLYPVDILKECPKFRILIIGQAGAGKTTLCGKVFNVDAKNPIKVKDVKNLGVSSAYGRGTQASQVWKEITFDGHNEDIILHDSGGFEASDESKFDEIRTFIDDRLSKTKLADQLHCIWYCISMIGHRQIQESEEKFFKEVNVGDIPVIAVFTHFDRIEDDHEFALMKKHQRLHPNTPIPSDVTVNAHALAVRDYDEIYRPNLEKVTGRRSKVAFRRVSMPEDDPSRNQGIQELVRTTFDMLTTDGSLRRLWTAAQQQDAGLKREASIAIAMEYLSTVAISSSIPFPFIGGGMFFTSFDEIMRLVPESWGLIDPKYELGKKSTRKRFFEACLKLSAAGRIGVKAGMALNFLSVATAPFITVALLRVAAGLIIIHEDLFWRQREEEGFQLTTETVREVALGFSESEGRVTASAHIGSQVEILNFASKAHCQKVLATAIRLARGEESWQQEIRQKAKTKAKGINGRAILRG